MKRPNKSVYSLEKDTRRLIVSDPFLDSKAISKYGKGNIVKANAPGSPVDGQPVKIVRIMDRVDYAEKTVKFEYMVKSLPGNGDQSMARVVEELLCDLDPESELLADDIAYVNAHIKLSIKKEFIEEIESMEGHNIKKILNSEIIENIISAYADNIEIYYDKNEEDI